jgi:hypothetical protein
VKAGDVLLVSIPNVDDEVTELAEEVVLFNFMSGHIPR